MPLIQEAVHRALPDQECGALAQLESGFIPAAGDRTATARAASVLADGFEPWQPNFLPLTTVVSRSGTPQLRRVC